MATKTVYAKRCALVSEAQPTESLSYGATVYAESATGATKKFVIEFDLPDEVKKAKITDVVLHVYVNDTYVYSGKQFYVEVFDKLVDGVVCWNNLPYSYREYVNEYTGASSVSKYFTLQFDTSYKHQNYAARNGIAVFGFGSNSFCIYTDKSSYQPYLEITYEPITYSLKYLSPSSGSINRANDNVFRWNIQCNGSDNNPPSSLRETQTSAVFRWRTSSGGDINTISVGTENNITVPAGTFTTASIEWSVEVALSDGNTLTSDWYTVSTADSTPGAAQIVQPSGTILDGTRETVFEWKHVIDTGTAQSKAELQISTDGSTFSDLATIVGSANTYTAAADVFSSGDLYWRVRTYNTDDAAGAWSETAHVLVVAAPAAPVVILDTESPRPVISWQAVGQQAYEVVIGAHSSGIMFGTDKVYQPEEYLPDGQYIAGVRVQNKYGLWSPWGEVGVTVANTEGDDISLSVASGSVATLSWYSDGTYSKYVVVRNGRPITETTATSFTDHFANGSVSYQIRGILDGNNYTLSNAVDAIISCDALMIAAVDDPEWLTLRLSETSNRRLSYNAARSVKYIHYAGASLPSAEVGEAIDGKYTFDAAFTHADRARAEVLEALMGRVVCVKDAAGKCVIGVLGGYSLKSSRFYRAYSCTVTEIAWTEGAK